MPVLLSFTVQDGKGEESEIQFRVLDDGDLNLLNLYEALNNATAVLRNIIVGGITGARMSYEINLAPLFDSFPSFPVPEEYADVEEGAVFTWLPGSNIDMKQRIPTFDETLLIPGTREIDFADLRVIAFVEMMTTGIDTSGPTVQAVDSHGHIINSVLGGEENFKPRKRKNRRG